MSHRKLRNMFEEYNYSYFDELIKNDAEFAYLATRYHDLDVEIRNLSDNSMHNLRERLKRYRLQIKDEAYSLLLMHKIKYSKEDK